jgi:hypothetical protein
MSNKDLKRNSHRIDDDHWWYEESDGIHIVFHGMAPTKAIAKISWRAIRAALARKAKK